MFEEKTLPYIGAKISKDFRIERVINLPRPPQGEEETARFMLRCHNPSDGSVEFDLEIFAFENTFCVGMPRMAASYGE